MPEVRTKVQGLTSILIVGLVFFVALSACRSSKTNDHAGKKVKTGWLARIFGKGSGKKSSNYHLTPEIKKIIETARSYRGTPHRDGGVSRMGIDCSALIQLSFQSAGIKLPRTANQQSLAGKPIDRKSLQPGDLIFFSDRKIGKGITHVGLVTEILDEGEIKFIHTSSRLGVTENLLSTNYFNKTYAKAVRPF